MKIDFDQLPYDVKADLVHDFYRGIDAPDGGLPKEYEDYMDDEKPLTLEIISKWTDGDCFQGFLDNYMNDAIYYFHQSLWKELKAKENNK